MEDLVEKMFSLNLNVLKIFGFYSPRKYARIYRVYSYFVFIILITPPLLLTGVYLLVKDNLDMAVAYQNAFAIIELGNDIFKISQFVWNFRKIRKCIHMIESPVFLSYTQDQQHIMEDCVTTCSRNSFYYQILCIMTDVSWAIAPLFENVYRLPLDLWLPWDVSSGGLFFTSSYIFIVAGATIDSMSTGAIDPLMGGLAYYAITQLRILKDNVQNMSKYVAEVTRDHTMLWNDQYLGQADLESRIICDKLNSCIKHHNAILDFVQMYEDTFSPMVFVQFTTSVIVICISVLRLSMVEPFTADFFAMVIFITAVLIQILFYCYYGTILFEESCLVTDAAYTSDWFDYDMKNRKILLVLMERCKRPIQVTAGKILDLSLNTFMTILKRSYSLLAVLKNY